ncbi:MAG: zinc-ribbon domain-containing protein [Deltaproteobacteria bacterium]|nr:zinc-ribbon domain-containing protein [Deltaproteobacteria bacterium]
MLIECQSCQKKLNISEEKIPFGRPFTFTCPNCKEKNTMMLPERRVTEISLENDEPPPPPGPRQAGPEGAAPAKPFSNSTNLLQAGPPMFPDPAALPPDLDDVPEGMKLALVAFDNEEIADKVTETLTNMGFRVSVAINVRDAVKQLKFGRFQLLVIQEDYYGATLGTNQIIRAVNSMELSIRHNMFVAVVGPSFTSLDDLTSFSLSLDSVINSNDLDDIERILISAMGHVKKFFSAYKELRQARGFEYN